MTTEIGHDKKVVKNIGAAQIKDDLDFFVVIKSRNHRQDNQGNLKLLNYHFFAEIFVSAGKRIDNAKIFVGGLESNPLIFRPHSDDVLGDNAWYLEGGWYASEKDLDKAFPSGEYIFDITSPYGRIRDGVLDFSRVGQKNEIPDPVVINLSQDGSFVAPNRLEADADVTVTWGDYRVGCADPRAIIDDQVFVVVADCFGNRIVKSGLSFEQSCLTFRDKDYVIPAGTLLPGCNYSMFVELPHVADSTVRDGVAGFASFATATYLQLQTLGKKSGIPCPKKPIALDTGETDVFAPSLRDEHKQIKNVTRQILSLIAEDALRSP